MFTLIVQRDSLEEIFLEFENEELTGFRKFLSDVRSVKLVIDVSLESSKDYANNNPLYEFLIDSIVDYCFLPELTLETIRPYLSEFVFGVVNTELEKDLRKLGYPSISKDTFHDWKIYDTQGERKDWEVSDQESEFTISSWSKLGLIKHPWNSLFILDYYMLAEKWDNQKKGWAALIDQILENESTKGYITIVPLISAVKDSFGKKANITPNERDDLINKVKQNFHSQIAHHRTKGKKIKSCIALMKEDKKIEKTTIHDRYLITNGFYIESGTGFNLFGSNSLTETTLKCQFVFYSEVAFKVGKRLKRWSEYLEKLEHNPEKGTVSSSKNWFGDKEIGFFEKRSK